MNRELLRVCLCGLLLLMGCREQPKIETVTEEKPYSVRVAQARSIYQAQKIQERLQAMGVEAYMLESLDSVDRTWYNVMSGAFADSAACSEHLRQLDSAYRFPNLRAVNTQSFADSVSVVVPGSSIAKVSQEKRRLDANPPAVPQGVMEAVQKFPENNAFYLQRVNVLNFESSEGLKRAGSYSMDMPRGISVREVSAVSLNLVEVQYQDNLYEDNVTLSIAKLKTTVAGIKETVFDEYGVAQPEKYTESYAVALQFSEEILGSGDYEDEQLEPIEWEAYKPLLGYEVGLTTNSGARRSYFVVVDSDCEYLIMAQSVQKSGEQMQQLLAEVGRGKGLEQYDEFYNSFYLLPDVAVPEDIFLGYTIEKLDWRYAMSKGYSDWSKAMVGHWGVNGYFYNLRKGLWDVGVYDLLTDEAQDNIYGTLYTDAVGTKENQHEVYGVQGHYVGSSWWRRELNFGFARYVCAIEAHSFELEDYIDRAERMQFVKGGYKRKNVKRGVDI